MARFDVVYRGPNGETVTESRYGASREALLQTLRASGMVPISVQRSAVAGPGRLRRAALAERFLVRKVKLSELAVAFRTLATMLGGGLPVVECLVDVGEQAGQRRFRQVMLDVAADVRKGTALSAAMGRHSTTFSPLARALIRAGEESGNLQQICEDLAQYLENQVDLQRKIRTGTRYPMLISVFFCFALSVVYFYVLPKFAAIFKSFDVQLPLLTRILLGVSSGITDNLVYVVPALAALVLGLLTWLRSTTGQGARNAAVRRLPIVGRIAHQLDIARLTRALGLLFESGVPVVEALQLAAMVPTDPVLREQTRRLRERVVMGASMAEELAKSPVFPRLMVRMTAAGEASGKLGDMLKRTSEHFSREASANIAVAVSVLEPVLLALLGIVIGTTVVAVYLPIFNLAKAVR